MNTGYEEFESIGDNCEFAFFLRDSDCDDGSMFRWTLIKNYDSFIGLLNKDFENIFEYKNLVPSWQDMVLDKSCDICFHTKMYSDNVDGEWQWRFSEKENIEIHKNELEKLDYLIDKFKKGVSSGKKTYVLKNNASNLDAQAQEISKYLKKLGTSSLLYVKKADENNTPGKIVKLDNNFFIGFIDRFADYSRANEYSRSGWELLLKNYNDIK